uniref:Uncharacterized protein n=1 Tax=Anguilla anguilla TaxID=7936 RepID=A0A0E9T5J9_ANGAN
MWVEKHHLAGLPPGDSSGLVVNVPECPGPQV